LIFEVLEKVLNTLHIFNCNLIPSSLPYSPSLQTTLLTIEKSANSQLSKTRTSQRKASRSRLKDLQEERKTLEGKNLNEEA
jgi:hypothetical protein